MDKEKKYAINLRLLQNVEIDGKEATPIEIWEMFCGCNKTCSEFLTGIGVDVNAIKIIENLEESIPYNVPTQDESTTKECT